MIAIDPGQNGSVVWRDQDGAIQSHPMPETESDVCGLLCHARTEGQKEVVIEQVGGWGMPGPRGFTFGRGVGLMIGACMTLGMRIVEVTPQKWQKHFSLGNSKSAGGKKPWKLKLLAEAQKRFPGVEVTLQNADALLILDFAEHTKP